MLAGIEAGGTKIIVAVGPDPQTVLRRTSIPTGAPGETLDAVIAFLRDGSTAPVTAIGIGSFGPLDLDPASPRYGSITSTPKPGWSGINLHAILAAALGCRVIVDTDVNASGLAEAVIGAGRGLSSLAYVTVGTGIGGGLILDGRPVHGLGHPEMGHIRPRRHADDATVDGICPFHGDCLEGLASGKAIAARHGAILTELPPDHPAWAATADYLGQLCATLVLTAAPQRIVLGGGVLSRNPTLFDPIRTATQAWLGGYVQTPQITTDIDHYIVPPTLGDHAGIIGAVMLAQQG